MKTRRMKKEESNSLNGFGYGFVVGVIITALTISFMVGDSNEDKKDYHNSAYSFCKHYNMTLQEDFDGGKKECGYIDMDDILVLREIENTNSKWGWKE